MFGNRRYCDEQIDALMSSIDTLTSSVDGLALRVRKLERDNAAHWLAIAKDKSRSPSSRIDGLIRAGVIRDRPAWYGVPLELVPCASDKFSAETIKLAIELIAEYNADN